MQAFKAAFATDGTDWDKLPYDMYKHGAGGMMFGTLCGVPNGCGGLCNLLGLGYTMSPSILGHYSTTEFPTSALPDLYYADTGYGPSNYTYTKQPIADDEMPAHTTALSTLCHVSISKFCYAAGINLVTSGPHGYAYKADRCGKIVGDMAAYTAGLINDYALGMGVTDPYVLPAEAAACAGCHTSSSDPTHMPAQNGQLLCNECHGDHTFHAGAALTIFDTWVSTRGNVIKPGYYPNQDVRYHVTFSVNNRGTTFVRNVHSKAKGPTSTGTWTDTLLRQETLGNGASYEWKYDTTIPASAVVGSKGTLVMRLTAADSVGGSPVAEDLRIVKFPIVDPY
jgi:hypothetical protein